MMFLSNTQMRYGFPLVHGLGKALSKKNEWGTFLMLMSMVVVNCLGVLSVGIDQISNHNLND